MRRIFMLVGMGVLAFLGILAVRTALSHSRQLPIHAVTPIVMEKDRAIERFAKALRFKTISQQDPAQVSTEEFAAFRQYLAESFPNVHAALKREIINGNALLYTWPGSDPSLPPALLIAHYDVVPVDPGSEGKWTHPPFAGDVADGYVWGRGATDFKCGVLGLLEAGETLLSSGFQPRRTILLGFGNDEEAGGAGGAGQIAKTLKERGVKASFVLDEGSAITQGILPGVAKPVGIICLSEKGYVSLTLSVDGPGGHSSTPLPESTIGILARAVSRLETHPMPAHLEGPIRQMLEYAGPEMAFPMRVVMANLWALSPVVKWQLSQTPTANAALRTTTAPTIIQAGNKDNVLPAHASAVVNFRILPGDSVEKVITHARQVIADARVTVAPLSPEEAREPAPVSRVDVPAYQLIAASVREIVPEAVVVPGLTLGGTDARNYIEVAEDCYRLQPMILNQDDLSRIHGTDERLSVENYLRGVQIYAQVIRNACQ